MTFALTADNAAHVFDLALDPQSVLDIRDAIFRNVNLAPGSAIPSDGDPRIDRALPGFLFTCGPDHIRHPEPVEGAPDGRRYPLHGSYSSHPAKDILIEEDENEAVCSARVRTDLANGETAELARRWHADRVTGDIRLDDSVTNTGNGPWPPVAMYHMNINTRLFDDRTKLTGAMLPGGELPWRFADGDVSIFCVPAGDAATDGWAEIAIGPIASLGGRSLHVKFRVDTLPYLQVWRNQSPGCHVMGIEPVSNRLASRAELIAAGEMPDFAPGESVDYALAFSVR
ncbi:DUF4432 family protein [Sinorhizobium sp. BG8]|uniref:DUF4432 family protein n=1 Tax=Sinorhizobium sp. BG8 TaxID=2613773 RepID=UPI00193DB53E|nr:DUF4432 family protein [Sinorhizobium sp. BG8]QRM56014.1 DUF4432 family protein [Sinorhizobium sp. BG8]